ncbi:MAG: hypothetical protein WAN46_08390 [Gammaproteobacteria bacterium]|jgi:hypothetical protein
MNRQLLESAKVAQPLVALASDLDEIVIPIATARAIIERDRPIQQQSTSSTQKKQQAALEAMPHVVDALVAMWGYHECSNYLRKLMVIDSGRDHRQGFSREAFDELVFLYRLIQDNRGSVIEEKMPKIQLDELKHHERLMQIESAYLRRS